MTGTIAALFRALGRARSAPAFHPTGRVFEGKITATPTCPSWLPLSSGGAPALVRLSKGVGLPGGAPDILGLAVRTWPGGRSWDLLLSSSAFGVLPFPAREWGRANYSTIGALAGTHGGGVLLARPRRLPAHARLDALNPLLPFHFDLLLRGTGLVGRLSITRQVDPGRTAFDPVRNAGGLELRPRWLRAVRAAAYAGSRAGRDAEAAVERGSAATPLIATPDA
ncbi:hypothetical protein BJP25_15215 [Actinokineospora bangkokensis]|uniref:Phosphodiesterase n=1 Tax=Actinokineospora bangkokensis TaxID=1193682 RepID=A0A1Q9LPH6_9PSEU|nr:hypothetical protein BJP25_15215 [Actinokineospora bangkokensis]